MPHATVYAFCTDLPSSMLSLDTRVPQDEHHIPARLQTAHLLRLWHHTLPSSLPCTHPCVLSTTTSCQHIICQPVHTMLCLPARHSGSSTKQKGHRLHAHSKYHSTTPALLAQQGGVTQCQQVLSSTVHCAKSQQLCLCLDPLKHAQCW